MFMKVTDAYFYRPIYFSTNKNVTIELHILNRDSLPQGGFDSLSLILLFDYSEFSLNGK